MGTLLSHLKILLPTHMLSIGGSSLWVPPLVKLHVRIIQVRYIAEGLAPQIHPQAAPLTPTGLAYTRHTSPGHS